MLLHVYCLPLATWRFRTSLLSLSSLRLRFPRIRMTTHLYTDNPSRRPYMILVLFQALKSAVVKATTKTIVLRCADLKLRFSENISLSENTSLFGVHATGAVSYSCSYQALFSLMNWPPRSFRLPVVTWWPPRSLFFHLSPVLSICSLCNIYGFHRVYTV